MSNLYRMLIAALVALVATSFAEATCGDSGGPGYRGPNNNKCVGWEALGRVCGCPPTTRCTPEQTAPDAEDAACKGKDIEEKKKRQHDEIQRRGTHI